MTSSAAPAEGSLVRHDIDVGNMLYGSAHFISLRLPEQWDIAPGVGHPEVMAVHERAGRRWIVSGRAWYVLYHRDLGWAMELKLESTTRPRRPRSLPEPAETLEVHGHHAQIRRWRRRRGLLHPRTITFIEVVYDCERSDRHIRLELSGRCPPEGFEQMLRFIPAWWCH